MLEGLFLAGAMNQMARSNEALLAGELASMTSREVGRDNVSIKFDIEKLMMITEALWTLLKRQAGYTDEQLMEVIRGIDLRDGRLDGKVARSMERPDCPQCGKKAIGAQPLCLYCGAELPARLFER